MGKQLNALSPVAIIFFFVFIGVTLVITAWAARQSKSAAQFYAAGGGISGFQNGLALAGDFMSAASFLGIAGLVATGGYDGLIYSVGYLVGWPLVMFLIAEPLRNLGKYTFADVVAFRLGQKPIRTMAAIGSITTVLFYLTAQMVGAGSLIELMFGLRGEVALIGVGVLMIAYVLFGGMLATTWVQIIKACLLLGGATILAGLVLAHFGWSYGNLFGAVAARDGGAALLAPKNYGVAGVKGVATSSLDLLSLSLGLMFGTAGLPHILMRFYTVPDAREARKSVFVATGFIGYFYILTFTIGYGAAALVAPALLAAPDKGGLSNNAAAPLLAQILGGDAFLGFICAVSFATILAVVAGLTLAGASAISHDIYAGVIKTGQTDEKTEVKVAKTATVGLGILAVALGLLFKGVNVAFMVGLAFAVAASANFPALLLSVIWKKFTTQAAVASMATGLISAVALIFFSPTVWVDVLHHAKGSELVPFKNPALISMSLAFIVGIVVSLVTRDAHAEEFFEVEQARAMLGAQNTEVAEH